MPISPNAVPLFMRLTGSMRVAYGLNMSACPVWPCKPTRISPCMSSLARIFPNLGAGGWRRFSPKSPKSGHIGGPPDDHRAICRDVLLGARDPHAAAVAEFRLDDDDAIAVDYVAQLRRNWPKLARLAGPNGRVALDHGRGMVLQARPDDQILVHPLLTLCWSAGLSLFMRPDDTGIIMDFPHHRIWQRVPFVNLTESVMFIRGDHATNDSRTPFDAATPVPLPEAEIAEILMRRFGIDLAAFRNAWPLRAGRG